MCFGWGSKRSYGNLRTSIYWVYHISKLLSRRKLLWWNGNRSGDRIVNLPCSHESRYPVEGCRICFLNQTRPDYAKIFRSRTIQRVKTAFLKPCVYLGELIEKKPFCGCGARHKCAIYGECVVSGKGAGKWRVCTECQNYKTEWGKNVVERFHTKPQARTLASTV